MDKALVAKTLKTVRDNSPKKNFKQSIDLIINLKDIDIKKQEQLPNTFVTLHSGTGKKASVCALVGKELEKQAKEICDETILAESFARYKDKKEIKKLAKKHDFFIAQANIMPQIATAFGRVLGPRGKMPNPRLGSILAPNASIKPLYDKLAKTIKIATRNEPCIKCMVGKEDSNEDEVIDNILTIYNSTIHLLPNERHNVKSVMLKLTMGPAFIMGEEAKKAEAAGEKQELKVSAEEKASEPKKKDEKSGSKKAISKEEKAK